MGTYSINYDKPDDYIFTILDYIYDTFDSGEFGDTQEELIEHIDEAIMKGAKKWLEPSEFLGLFVYLADEDDYIPLACKLLDNYVKRRKGYYQESMASYFSDDDDDDY